MSLMRTVNVSNSQSVKSLKNISFIAKFRPDRNPGPLCTYLKEEYLPEAAEREKEEEKEAEEDK